MREVSIVSMGLRCILLLLTVCLAWADDKPRVLSTEPSGAVIYLVDPGETAVPPKIFACLQVGLWVDRASL